MNGKTVLVTGISGFIGSHLAVLLTETFSTARVLGIDRRRLSPLSWPQAIDLSKKEEVSAVVKEISPDYIFHLAGVTHTKDIEELFQGNVATTVNVLEATEELARPCRVVILGSAAEYGQVSLGDLPLREDKTPAPVMLYGVAKVWQTTTALYYAQRGVDVTVGRLFNIIGKGMSTNLSVGAFAAQLKRMLKHDVDHRIKVGNLKPKRDFLDIDDVSKALIALALKGTSGQIYNVCSGGSISMSEVLKKLIDQVDVEVEVVIDTERIKAADIRDSYGSYQKLNTTTGWRPAVSLDESLAKLMN